MSTTISAGHFGRVTRFIRGEVFSPRSAPHFWKERFLPRWLPLVLGFGLGSLVAFLAVAGMPHYATALVVAIPVGVLLLRYPFAAVLIWVLAFPYFVHEASTVAQLLHWVVGRTLIPVALVVTVLGDWLGTRKRPAVRLGVAELVITAFVWWIVASLLLLSDDVYTSATHLYDRVLLPLLLYLLIRLAAPTERDLRRLGWVAFVTIVGQSTIGLTAWFAPNLLPAQWANVDEGRTAGTFGNPAVYSTGLALLSIVLLRCATSYGSRLVRLAFVLAVALGLIAVFFTFSRGSWLASSIVLLALLLIYPRWLLPLVAAGLVGGLVLANSLLADSLAWAWTRLNTETTAETRIVVNMASITMVQQRPWLGWGYDNYDNYASLFKAPVLDIPVRNDNTSHNTYLSIMAELGLPGFALYVFPVAWWLVLSLKAWRRLPRDGFLNRAFLVTLWLSVLHGFVVSNFMDMIRHHTFGTGVWWLALGLIANLVYPAILERRAQGDYRTT